MYIRIVYVKNENGILDYKHINFQEMEKSEVPSYNLASRIEFSDEDAAREYASALAQKNNVSFVGRERNRYLD